MALDAHTRELLDSLHKAITAACDHSTTPADRQRHHDEARDLCIRLHDHLGPAPRRPYTPRTPTSRDGPGPKGLRLRDQQARARAARRPAANSPIRRCLTEQERRRKE